jgi:alkanesulfonate monooxygenase SsuD/methylene tetrahydromethanopterin reductase-like flavin-dependent oxidoreductase (luciferase family)
MKSAFGILMSQTCSWDDLKTQAQDIEDAGFQSIWVADQIANPFLNTDWLEGWTVLTGLAIVTERIRLGTLVTNIVYRHPGLLAKQAITVDHMSNGRLELGLGAGGAPTDHSMTGTPYWSGTERQRRFNEFVRVIEQLLTTETSSFAGDYYSFDDTYISPPPLQTPRPPLVIAAHGPKSMQLAAEHADKWSFFEPGTGLKGRDAATAMRKMNSYIDEKALAAGRDPAAIARSYCCGFSASSAWGSLDEALSDIALYEEAGVDEFILSYAPNEDFVSEANLEMQTGETEISLLLRNKDDLRSFMNSALG